MPRPDEGLIHAWLDGQLSPEEAARVEQLVATDATWREAAAEARGLVAASSRILATLDDVPGGVIPAGTATRTVHRLPWWTKAAAAIVVIAGASTLVFVRGPEPSIPVASSKTVPSIDAPPVTLAIPSPPRKQLAIAKVDTRAGSATAKRAEPSKPKEEPIMAIGRADSGVVATTTEQRQAGAEAKATLFQRQQSIPLTELVVTGVAAPTDAAQRDAAKMGAQRVAAERAVSKEAMQPPNNQVAKAAQVAPAATRFVLGACYVMRDSRTSAGTGLVMRGERQDGDTLFLGPLKKSSLARGWVMMRDGVLRGVLTTEADGRGMVLVTATPAPCNAP